ncbi:MAG: S9 family peptidase, partial [Acidobacteria bacterium]|nr:S9 family peptidase [Acidobacteriota bacterium]
MKNKNIFFALLVALALIVSVQAQDSKKLTLDLFLDWEYALNPQISPDGTQIIYTRRWTDKVNDKYENDVWIMNADGTRNRFLLKGASPAWSPDGKRVAYVAPGQPTGTQIFVKWLDAADAGTQVTRLERAPTNLQWSPDGKSIAFNMLVPAKANLKVNVPNKPEGAKWIEPPRVVDRLNYRSDASGYRPEGFMHIFVVGDTGSTPRQLTDGDYNHDAPEWMPDSNTIIFSATRKPDAEYVRFGSEIYSLNIKSNQIKPLTDRDGTDSEPTVSPDGKQIAYVGSDRNDDTYNIQKLYVMNSDGLNKRVLSENFDRSPFGLMWSETGDGVYFATEDKGTNNLYFVPTKGGAPRQITTGNHQFLPSSMSRNGTVAGVLSDTTQTGDIASVNVKGNKPAPRKLTDVNGDLMENRRLGAVEEIWYDSVGGMKVQGWIVKPPDFNPSKKYPLILYIHGGPHAMYGIGFNFEFQNHAA